MTEIWRPSAARVADANLTRFMESLNARKGLQLRDYAGLYAWSIEQPAEFWTEVARFTEIRADWGAGPAIATDPATRASGQPAQGPGQPTRNAGQPAQDLGQRT